MVEDMETELSEISKENNIVNESGNGSESNCMEICEESNIKDGSNIKELDSTSSEQQSLLSLTQESENHKDNVEDMDTVEINKESTDTELKPSNIESMEVEAESPSVPKIISVITIHPPSDVDDCFDSPDLIEPKSLTITNAIERNEDYCGRQYQYSGTENCGSRSPSPMPLSAMKTIVVVNTSIQERKIVSKLLTLRKIELDEQGHKTNKTLPIANQQLDSRENGVYCPLRSLLNSSSSSPIISLSTPFFHTAIATSYRRMSTCLKHIIEQAVSGGII
uniref:Uncharacterized protein n=1 Tax=Megaselia scalaris TaxID=36166 RepID=T1H494_MEGSC